MIVFLFLLLVVLASGRNDENIAFWESYTETLVSRLKLSAKVVSRDPLMLRASGFLSSEECRGLIETQRQLHLEAESNSKQRWCFNGNTRYWLEQEKKNLNRIDINDEDSMEEDTYCTTSEDLLRNIPSEIRDSTGSAVTFWGHTLLKYPSLIQLETRIQNELGLPTDFGAPAQLLYYPAGSHYRAHLDCGGNLSGTVTEINERIFSILIYLNDVENGGETVFPNIPVMSKARAGDALIWRSLDLRNRSCTNATLHSAGIVRVGEKFAYQRWFHLHPKRYDDFVEKFSNLRRLANIKADSTVVCESVVGSCRNYITVIPPDSDFFEDLETERRMLDRRSETSSQKWIEIRRVVTTIRFLERQVKMSCDRSVMLVHDANRLLQKNIHVVRALRRHAEIVFVESAGLGAVAFLAASFGTYTTFHVSSCERAQYIRDVWSDLNVSSFLRKRMRVTCGNDIVVKSSEASQVLIEFETCTPIIPQRYILKQGNILVSYRNLTSSLLPSSSFSNVVTSYVSDTYRPLLYSGTTTALDDDDDDLRATCEVSSSSSSSRDDEGHRRVFIYY